uniref:Uncharacterized protein n=1 Tax=Octopus bimaculoides TaxID=37653 RepID=A0A0L8HAQ0_OCTBM
MHLHIFTTHDFTHQHAPHSLIYFHTYTHIYILYTLPCLYTLPHASEHFHQSIHSYIHLHISTYRHLHYFTHRYIHTLSHTAL